MTSSANEKTIYWQSVLEKWKYSGLSWLAFSSWEGIDVERLIYWKRALIDRGLFTDGVSVSKVAKSKELLIKIQKDLSCLPVNIMLETTHPSILPSGLKSFIYIQLNSKNRLVIPYNFNSHTLAKVLEIL